MLESLEVIGIAIIFGLLAAKIFFKLKIPAVAAYVLIGVILGESILNIFHEDMLNEIRVINDIALGMIAFIIGGELRWKKLKALGPSIIAIALLESLGATIVVTGSIYFFFHNLPLAIVLGAISAATAPAATVMVIRELQAKGILTNTLLSTVAIDDAIALFIFSFGAAIAKSMFSNNHFFNWQNICFSSLWEIVGAIGLGLFAGAIYQFLITKVFNKDAHYILTIAVLLIVTGLANNMGVSSLLANLFFGIFIVNALPSKSKNIFSVIDNVAPPIFIAFFVTAGAHLRIDLIFTIWPVAIIYTIARIIGKITGASIGATIAKTEKSVKKYIGFGLVSQVGVAIGLSLIVSTEFAEFGPAGKHFAKIIINVLLTTTVFTEILGPILTRYALIKAGETKNN